MLVCAGQGVRVLPLSARDEKEVYTNTYHQSSVRFICRSVVFGLNYTHGLELARASATGNTILFFCEATIIMSAALVIICFLVNTRKVAPLSRAWPQASCPNGTCTLQKHRRLQRTKKWALETLDHLVAWRLRSGTVVFRGTRSKKELDDELLLSDTDDLSLVPARGWIWKCLAFVCYFVGGALGNAVISSSSAHHQKQPARTLQPSPPPKP